MKSDYLLVHSRSNSHHNNLNSQNNKSLSTSVSKDRVAILSLNEEMENYKERLQLQEKENESLNKQLLLAKEELNVLKDERQNEHARMERIVQEKEQEFMKEVCCVFVYLYICFN